LERDFEKNGGRVEKRGREGEKKEDMNEWRFMEKS